MREGFLEEATRMKIGSEWQWLSDRAAATQRSSNCKAVPRTTEGLLRGQRWPGPGMPALMSGRHEVFKAGGHLM
jgi:hypothetical protein